MKYWGEPFIQTRTNVCSMDLETSRRNDRSQEVISNVIPSCFSNEKWDEFCCDVFLTSGPLRSPTRIETLAPCLLTPWQFAKYFVAPCFFGFRNKEAFFIYFIFLCWLSVEKIYIYCSLQQIPATGIIIISRDLHSPCNASKHELHACHIPERKRPWDQCKHSNSFTQVSWTRTLLRLSVSVKRASLPKLSTSSSPYCSMQDAAERKSSDSKTGPLPSPETVPWVDSLSGTDIAESSNLLHGRKYGEDKTV